MIAVEVSSTESFSSPTFSQSPAESETHLADHHYDTISALHKSVRGGDANAALYWLARMLEGGDDPLYVARRLMRMASEDIGLANPQLLTMSVSAYQATQLIGMPECDVSVRLFLLSL